MTSKTATANKTIAYSASVILALLCAVAQATDVEFSAEGISVADDGTTTYSGEVVVRVSAGTAMQVTSKSTRTDKDVQVLEGDVQIKVDGQLIKTEKARLKKLPSGETVIEMDTADSSDISGK